METEQYKKYLKENLSSSELNHSYLFITCPDCGSKGCNFCNNKGFLNPKSYLKEEVKMEDKATVKEAATSLAEYCDGAASEDGVGFNKIDTGIMHDLIRQDSWTEKQERVAHKILQKYRRQLKEFHGINYDELEFEFTGIKAKKDQEKEPMVLEADTNQDDRPRLLLNSRYEFKDKAKAIPHSRWLPSQKLWRYWVNEKAVLPLVGYINKGLIEPTEEAYKLIEEVLDKYNQRIEQIEKVAKIKDRDPGVIEIEPPPLKYKLYDHQQKAFEIGYRLNTAGLLMEQGTGKTLSSIAIVGKRFLEGKVNRLLVICPKSVIEVWEKEFQKHAEFPYEIKGLLGPTKKRASLLKEWSKNDEVLQIAIINYESTWRIEKALLNWDPDQVILDESQKIKNGQTKQAKFAHKIGKKVKYKNILTGTPITQGPLDFHSQYKFLNPNIFGKSFYKFREKYAIMGGYGGYEIKGYRDLEELAEKAHRIAYRITKDEALDLPETINQNLYCDLSNKAKKYYKEMEKEFFFTIEEKEVDAPIVLTKLLRLQQITGGFVPTTGTEEKEILDMESEKLKVLDDYLSDYYKDKLVIFARFTPEIEAIKEVVKANGFSCKTLTGATNNRGELITEFQEEDLQILVIQIQTGGLGITLTATDTVIFYSTNFSYGDYDQAKARVHRIGQNKSVNYIHLITKDTIEEDIIEALKNKENMAKKVVDKYKGYDNSKKGEDDMAIPKPKNNYRPKRGVKMSYEEDKALMKKFKKLKKEMESEDFKTEGLEEIDKEFQDEIDDINKKNGITKTKKSKKEATKMTTKNEEAEVINTAMLAEEFHISAVTLRKKLRAMKIEKPGTRWEWPKDHEDLAKIREKLN